MSVVSLYGRDLTIWENLLLMDGRHVAAILVSSTWLDFRRTLIICIRVNGQISLCYIFFLIGTGRSESRSICGLIITMPITWSCLSTEKVRACAQRRNISIM